MQRFLTPSCLISFRRELNCAHYRVGRAGLRLGLIRQQCPAPFSSHSCAAGLGQSWLGGTILEDSGPGTSHGLTKRGGDATFGVLSL